MAKNLPWPKLTATGEVIIPSTGIPGFRLFVKQLHIDTGIRRNSQDCMESLPLQALGFSSVNVTCEYIRFNWRGIRYNYQHPAKGPTKLEIWDDEKEERDAAIARGLIFVSKVKPYSLMLRGATATCAPVLKRGPFKTPRAKHPTRGKKLKRGPRRSMRRYHGLREIVV